MTESVKTRYTKVEIILETVSIVALLSLLVFTLLFWPGAPPKTPSHFGWSGLPDAWDAKGMLPTMVYLTVCLFILFSVLSRFPRVINFPVPVTEANSKAQLQLRFSAIIWIKTELVIFTAYIGIQGMRIASGQAEGLGVWFAPVLLLVLFGTMVFFVYRAYRLN